MGGRDIAKRVPSFLLVHMYVWEGEGNMPVYRVSVLQNIHGQRIMNAYYYDASGAVEGASIVELADAIWDAYDNSGLDSLQCDDWSYAGIELRRVDVANLPAIEAAPTGGAKAGLNSNEVLPLQVALLVTGTALTAYPRRVRTYLGGLSEGGVANGLWNAGHLTAATAFVAAMDTLQITAVELERVAVELGGSAGAPVVTSFNRVLSYTPRPVPATQRRRRIGVGV